MNEILFTEDAVSGIRELFYKDHVLALNSTQSISSLNKH